MTPSALCPIIVSIEREIMALHFFDRSPPRALIPLRIDDPSGLIAQTEAKVSRAQILVSTGNASGAAQLARITASDSSGRSYQLAVPFDRLITLSVASGAFLFTSASGASLGRFASIPLNIKSGSTADVIRLSVAGGGR